MWWAFVEMMDPVYYGSLSSPPEMIRSAGCVRVCSSIGADPAQETLPWTVQILLLTPGDVSGVAHIILFRDLYLSAVKDLQHVVDHQVGTVDDLSEAVNVFALQCLRKCRWAFL